MPYRGVIILRNDADWFGQLNTEIPMRVDFAHSKQFPFLFTFNGQGSQWPGMGADLIRGFPGFSRLINELSNHVMILSEGLPWNLKGILREFEVTMLTN